MIQPAAAAAAASGIVVFYRLSPSFLPLLPLLPPPRVRAPSWPALAAPSGTLCCAGVAGSSPTATITCLHKKNLTLPCRVRIPRPISLNHCKLQLLLLGRLNRLLLLSARQLQLVGHVVVASVVLSSRRRRRRLLIGG
jgi:hypothetical protein